ncbi:MAG: hypothetical protein COZ07_09880 [Candidatus Infernicultor aquiphilus]|uniref:DUF5678 domain-containing protein n=1 Tax=Candidatus Infernicultor aquiphilus TaxID=1805029 RepID=A0A1J5H446_9BACT|nr:hypothetical protein [bacterium]OIP74846.1 MAG: hypothetical protein AUK42_00565 [Candidatus Atribacteria bacterium CG2_30_33_13]PIX34599.1 MAG: hypothetical protein COZ58_03375 [Candidatus Atribacteria bacterium CG_4_8_14_3_um_filter_34_18]PIY31270.1 MAG: hypothetical protein COZ07_09880 [Candidatus Atribacteria bacterium CG_4_10_14_3_um_filter_34_13]PJB56055.1 MAG: hypothetical protein CO097_06205 [Candidatus Atribacteria bacterium CG_4_9_14_3_um_filter_33_16]
MRADLLKKDLDYFESKLGELLGKSKGEYALIHEGQLIDTFKSKEDAIKRGYELFGNSPFLVKMISEVEDILNFTSNLLAS